MSVLLIEKTNYRFQRMTKSRLASGLSVCLKMIKESVPNINLVPVDTMQHVNLAISNFKPKKVVFETLWLSDENMADLRKKHPKVEFFIHIHSNLPFLACEGAAFNKISEVKKHGFKLIFNNKRAADCFDGSVFLPNIYSKKYYNRINRPDDEFVNVICAGSLRPMKNHVSQAMAAIIYAQSIGKKLRFYCNLGRSEGGDEVRSALTGLFFYFSNGHELISLEWMEHVDFIEYLKNMDIGLQVSMSESFNIVAADYTAAGLPMVVSDEVEWADDNCKAPTGDPMAIASVMARCSESVIYNRRNLTLASAEAINLWREFSGT